nr:MAG TPA: hypothetical protein [Bacteriophage sp.]
MFESLQLLNYSESYYYSLKTGKRTRFTPKTLRATPFGSAVKKLVPSTTWEVIEFFI